MLSFFPATANFAQEVMPYVTGPTSKVLEAIVGYIPELITLILIVFILRYLLKFLKNFFAAIGNEELKIRGFDPEWSEQTFRLIRIVIILAGIIVSYPFLPGSGSEIFKGFSVFIGAVITLGSTSAVNNIVSGIVLTYTRAFRIGDRVKIGEMMGDIVEKKLFVTRVKTFENELVTFPNGQVLGSSIVNLSSLAKTEGLFVNAFIGISYDVDWRKVHELMRKAAMQTTGVFSKPEPFVLETDLGDFAVTYKVMAKISEPEKTLIIEAELRRNLLDVFNGDGVEIMSPSVTSIRESTSPMIPADYNPQPFSFLKKKSNK
jgi:small-conductance mechanosensitive channel